MFGINVTEWIFILMLVLLLFGGKKIPELARSLGKGLSEFKKGVKEIEADVDQAEKPGKELPPAQQASVQQFQFDPYTGKPIVRDANQ
jgi:sec-independent protein translocase protein TatA